MTSGFLTLAGLLAVLTFIFWVRRQRPGGPVPDDGPWLVTDYDSFWLHRPVPPRKEFSPAMWRAVLLKFAREGNHEKALVVSEAFERERPADFGDWDRSYQAQLLSQLGQWAEAAAVHTALLEQPVPYPKSYNNRGYMYLLLGEYARSIPDFDQAIALDVSTAFAYDNRGLARLRLGQPAEARADIEHSLRLDPANSYVYRNLGIWHFEHQEFALALARFKEAAQLQWGTPDLEDYLRQTCEQLGVEMPVRPTPAVEPE